MVHDFRKGQAGPAAGRAERLKSGRRRAKGPAHVGLQLAKLRGRGLGGVVATHRHSEIDRGRHRDSGRAELSPSRTVIAGEPREHIANSRQAQPRIRVIHRELAAGGCVRAGRITGQKGDARNTRRRQDGGKTGVGRQGLSSH